MNKDQKYAKWNFRNIVTAILYTALCIICFPVNILVITGLVKTEHYTVLFIIGWLFWLTGMLLVAAPFIMFPRYGGVKKGESFVRTNKVVRKGIYGIVRHPQYLGGILSIFVTNLLWNPHCLFAVLGISGSLLLYISIFDEEKILINRFGQEYIEYMKEVPRINLILGLIRKLTRHSKPATRN